MAPHTESILQSADSDPLLTRRQFDSWTETFAARLRAVGVGPGDVVALNMPNCAAFVTTLHAVWQTGAACAPLNPVLIAREKAVLVDLVQPKLVVSCADPVPAGPVVTWGDPSGEPPEIERSRVRSVASGSAAAEDRLVLFTSGSSGTPKAVALTEDNVDAGIASVAEHFRLSEHDRTIAMLPWSHGHGLFASVLAPLRSGGTVVVATQKEMQQPHRLLTAARPTWLTVVPPQLELIIGAVERDAIEPPRMRFVRTASSPLARVSAQRAEDRLQCPAVEALGLTETSHQAAADRPTWNRRPGTVGVPTGGMAVRISGENVLGGGELEVRGPGLFRGYLGNAAATTAAMTHDGWFRTRDIATIEDGGHIRMIGRASEIVNRGGFKIAPLEVEAILSQHPAVVGALVTGVDHPTLGQEVAAAVVVREGSGAAVRDLLRYCRDNLAEYKVPGRIRLIEALPLLPNGKPSRRLIAPLFRTAP